MLQLVWQIVLEIILQLFFRSQVISFINECLKFLFNLVDVGVGFAKLQLSLFVGKLIINRFLHTLDTLVDKRLKITRVKSVGF